jgi:uncharacterized membrane protein YbaN (DUF454 family)
MTRALPEGGALNSRLAKEILLRYRPGTTDASDPELAEALEQAQRDPELARWFAQQKAFHDTIRDRLKQLPVPLGLKEEILAGYRPVAIPVWWQRPVFQALAAAAAVVLLLGIAFFRSPPREETSFAAFQSRVVRNAQRGYVMDIMTNDLAAIRQFLATHGAHADYVLPTPLEKLPGDGGAVLRWHNKIISMVCFDMGNHNDLFLFVANRADLPDAPATSDPQFRRIGRLTAASWSTSDRTYVLAGPGDEQSVRNYLSP